MSTGCPGPLVWFAVEATERDQAAAILECSSCPYVVVTGSFNDPCAHRHAAAGGLLTMGGVVAMPAHRHRCNPGVIMNRTGHAQIPDRYRYPPGTIWNCTCGRRFVAYQLAGSARAGNIGGIWWRPEHWWERLLRRWR